MGKKIETAVEQVKQELQQDIDNKLINYQQDKNKMRLAEMFGAIRAIEAVRIQVGSILNAQFMRGLEQFQENKGHEEYGYTRFDDFLDGYDNSPLTKRQYYDRREALNKEGDELFDALNALKIPMSARKLLTDGSIQIEGDEIIIGAERASLNDKVFIKQAIKALAQEQVKTTAKIENLELKLEKGEEENTKLKQEIDRLKLGSPIDEDNSAHPHSVAFMNLTVAFRQLCDEAAQLSEDEKHQLAPRTFETIAARMDKLSIAYNRTSGKTRKKKNDLPEVLPTVSDDELADLMD